MQTKYKKMVSSPKNLKSRGKITGSRYRQTGESRKP